MKLKNDKLLITVDDLHCTQGIDTYLREGKLTNTLAIKPESRAAFFAQRNETLNLLLREEQNPLLEEGALREEQRDRLGEHYLTFEALTLLIEKKIRHPKKSASGLSYNIKNLFVLKNDTQQLKQILLNLDLLTGDDAKIIYISGIHAVAVYLRNVNGRIQCFILDSEAGAYDAPEELISAIKSEFMGVQFYLSSTHLQKDFYSCSTFAFKTLLYFVKHGAEVFPWLERHSGLEEDEYYRLPPEKLMPRLLKMGQNKIELSDEILDSVVSNTPRLTLREYYARAAVTFKGKNFNSTALLKKYKYLAELNDYLEINLKNEKISLDNECLLPKGLQGRHQNYFRTPTPRVQRNKTNPVDVYLGILELSDNPAASVNPASHEALALIKKRFPLFDTEYQKLLVKQKAELTDKTRTQTLFFIAACAEVKDFTHVELFREFAKKLINLFGNYSTVLDFLRKYVPLDSRQPVHDVCIFPPPRAGEWDRTYWAKLAIEYGPQATQYLALAPRIDTLLKSPNVQLDPKHCGNELDKIRYLLAHFNYPRGNESKELSDLCRRHLVSEKDFERCLDIVNTELKRFDVLPDFTILGHELDPKLKNYRMIKLPIGDLRGFFLGEYSSCCQSIGKAGQSCAIHGMTSPMSGFYVVLDEKDQITAQTWAWVGTQGEFVFDSWEFSQSKKAFLFKPFISKAAELIIAHGFSRVLIGSGGRTPRVGFKSTEKPAKHPDPNIYSDAGSQDLILSADKKDLKSKWCISAAQISLQSKLEHIQSKLCELIAQNQLSFNDFLALVRVCYINRRDFLHHQSPEGLALLLQAFQQYGKQMEWFLNFKNHANHSVVEAVLQYDHVQLAILLMEALKPCVKSRLLSAGKEKIDRLLHLAARCNAKEVLYFLYTTVYAHLSWEEMISVQNKEEMSVLYVAAKHQHLELVLHIAEKFKDKEALFSLLNQCRPNELTIFHHLAAANKLAMFKQMHRLLAPDQFCQLLDNCREIPQADRGIRLPPVFLAICSDALETAEYLLSNFYDEDNQKKLLASKLEDRYIDSYLLGLAAKKNDLKLMKFLHRWYPDNDDWFVQLTTRQGYHRYNVLFIAIDARSWQCALYLLRSLKNVEQAHRLVSMFQNIHCSLTLTPSKSKELRHFIKHIIMIYAPYVDQFAELLLRDYRSFIRCVIQQQDIALFEYFLKKIVTDQALFNRLLNDDDYKDTLLDSILDVLDRKAYWQTERPVSFSLRKQFIDCLFRYCSPEQLKLQLSSISYLSAISATTLSYLLSIIDAIDDGAYRTQWLSLGDESPLSRVFHHPMNSDGVTQVMLDYAIRHCGEEAVQHYVLNVLRPWYHPIVSFDNNVLFHYIYPLIRSNPKMIGKLLKEMMEHFRQSSFGKSTFRWLLEQPEITTTHLKNCMSVEKRQSVFGQAYRLENLAFVECIWKACVKRMTTEELQQLIDDCIFDFLDHLFLCASYQNKSSIGELKSSTLFLRQWLLQLKTQDKLWKVLNTLNEKGQTYFATACNTHDFTLVKSILLIANPEQRRQLVHSVKPSEPVRQQKPLNLIKLVTHCERIDGLLALKAQINQVPGTRSRNSFFYQPPATDMASLRIHLKDINAQNCLFMDFEEIDSIWDNVFQKDVAWLLATGYSNVSEEVGFPCGQVSGGKTKLS